MASSLESIDTADRVGQHEDTGTQDRASFLRWLGRAGIGVVAATATLLSERRSASALACPGGAYPAQCCCLANPSDINCRCIAGGLHSWTCCNGHSLYECIECQDPAYPPTDTCMKGYFICSRAVNISTAC
jgi:hypothetical protein